MSGTRATVLLTQTPYAPQAWGGTGLAERFRARYLAGDRQPFGLVDRAEAADLIVYCEDYQESEQVYAPALRAERTVAAWPERVFVISSEDQPLGFLPGVYTSMPRPAFDDRRFRAGAYFDTINPLLAAAGRDATEPHLLFSFIGAPTAAVRRALFAQFTTTPHWHVRATGNAAFNIGVDDPAKRAGQLAYLETALASRFVLCPRGQGTASFRLFETMQLGRVPVILADDWVAPAGPAWPDCALRLAEHRVAELPDLLRRHEADAAAMGRRARAEWEAWFSPAVYARRCLEWIHALSLARTAPEAAQARRWPDLLRAAAAARAGGGRWRRLLRRTRALVSPARFRFSPSP